MSKLNKIYTKTGDKGQTSLIGGSRVAKHHARIEAYGTLDELNSTIGLVHAQQSDPHSKEILHNIQNHLFTAGSILACDKEETAARLPQIVTSDITMLENEIDTINTQLPELKTFILPGGSIEVSTCHIARCICRRAERTATLLAEKSMVNEHILTYLNRLSDYLFVLARKIAMDNNIPDITWKAGK